MRILVIGGGGREHAIVWKLQKESQSSKVFSVPGNGGICDLAECLAGDINAPQQMAEFAVEKNIDMTVVGPEVPLSLGIADVFRKRGLKIFGPSQKGACLESSKLFAKSFMKRNRIPTADFSTAESLEEALSILQKRKFPCVIKYDGLAAGKGVKVVLTLAEGIDFAEKIYIDKIFGSESSNVIVEDCLEGTEVSYLVFTDTASFAPMVTAKDHKRAFDGDNGPNTGGMGCYSPSPECGPKVERMLREEMVIPTLRGMQKENIHYRGVLYFGIMLTKKGPRLLEYNVRFGDPETQVILPRMENSLLETMDAVVEGNLAKTKMRWSSKKALCVILASGGYPGRYETGKEIKGLETLRNSDMLLFHAGTDKESSGKIVTSGGRVLGITALAEDIAGAREKVYNGVEAVVFQGKHYRKDIGL